MTPAEIAKKLTPYQREAAIALLDGERIRFFTDEFHSRLRPMVKMGLFEIISEMEWTATPLGLSVRALLSQEAQP
ncbi:hypothetical protein [Pseudoroseomonas ludipueritiae]|uniref:Uncharacterized protein n=1 Tax=Pseudoroseomonas ludipueritiae TaxID=198093 RepID=A0ABR7REB8_9PROT|nr:hypothetical protein [Pseudoroseomonas ludipueritiae]MBC9180220.1 hypothetical protein [Pseudoroseomonas ludipueritiae]